MPNQRYIDRRITCTTFRPSHSCAMILKLQLSNTKLQVKYYVKI